MTYTTVIDAADGLLGACVSKDGRRDASQAQKSCGSATVFVASRWAICLLSESQ